MGENMQDFYVLFNRILTFSKKEKIPIELNLFKNDLIT